MVVTASAAAGGLSALIASVSFGVDRGRTILEGRRRARRVWPLARIAADIRRSDGRTVPQGDYRCPRDLRRLEVDYDTEQGHCPACGRRYTVVFL